MERDLVLEPVPQDLVQAPKLDQPEVTQSTAQESKLQVLYAMSWPQATPPWAAAVMRDLDLDWVPTPQVLVQVVSLDQPESLQSTGQPKVLQEEKAQLPEQALPPLAWPWITDLERFLVPEPQVAEHEDHADHSESLQSTGHA